MIVTEDTFRRYIRRFEREAIPTRLELFIVSRKIKLSQFAREANLSRQHLQRIRTARMEPTRGKMALLVSAARRLSLEPVRPEDLFELYAEESGGWTMAKDRDRIVLAAAVYATELAIAEQRMATLKKRPAEEWAAHLASLEGSVTIPLLRLLLRDAHRQLDLDPQRASLTYAAIWDLAALLPEAVLPDLKVTIRALTLIYRAYVARHLGDYSLASTFLDDAEEEVEGTASCTTELAQIWYERAALLLKCGSLKASEREAKRAVMLFTVLGDQRRLARAQILNGSVTFERGDVACARDLWLRAIDPLRATRDYDAVASATLNIGAAEMLLGNVNVAKAWLEQAHRLFTKLGSRGEIIRVRWTLARLRLLHENPPDGLRLLRAVRADYLGANMPTEAGFVGLDIVEALLERDEPTEELVGLARSVVETFRQAGATPKMLEALYYLREAVQRRRADAELVSEIRAYLEEAARGTTAAFVPRTPEITASGSTECSPG